MEAIDEPMHPDERHATDAAQPLLPLGSFGKHAGGWYGVLTLIATEAALFGYLIFSYLYLASQTTVHWPPEGMPKLGPGLAGTAMLLVSSVFVWGAERLARNGRRLLSVLSMLVAVALGVAFIVVQLGEWRDHPYGPTANTYGSLYFIITGFHLLHVAIGLLILLLLAGWTALGYFDRERSAPLTIGGAYWHFVDVVWLFIFSTLYLTPYLF
ncbi:MAG: cytochrome c oxidase subunit 3 [Janthinobacterium lividum]